MSSLDDFYLLLGHKMIRISKWFTYFLRIFLKKKKKEGGRFKWKTLVADSRNSKLVIFSPVFYRVGLIALDLVMLLFQIFQKGCPSQALGLPLHSPQQ